MPKYDQDKEADDEDLSIKSVYNTMWNICKLKRTHSYQISH